MSLRPTDKTATTIRDRRRTLKKDQIFFRRGVFVWLSIYFLLNPLCKVRLTQEVRNVQILLQVALKWEHIYTELVNKR